MQQFIFQIDKRGGETMATFRKNNIRELKKLLYNSDVHDAKLENFGYKCGEDIIKMKLFNPIFNVEINIIFHHIGIALAINDGVYGNCETVNSLTVEEDFAYLQNYIPKYKGCLEDSLYLLFQMFSGDELHIVAKEVFVEIIR